MRAKQPHSAMGGSLPGTLTQAPEHAAYSPCRHVLRARGGAAADRLAQRAGRRRLLLARRLQHSQITLAAQHASHLAHCQVAVPVGGHGDGLGIGCVVGSIRQRGRTALHRKFPWGLQAGQMQGTAAAPETTVVSFRQSHAYCHVRCRPVHAQKGRDQKEQRAAHPARSNLDGGARAPADQHAAAFNAQCTHFTEILERSITLQHGVQGGHRCLRGVCFSSSTQPAPAPACIPSLDSVFTQKRSLQSPCAPCTCPTSEGGRGGAGRQAGRCSMLGASLCMQRCCAAVGLEPRAPMQAATAYSRQRPHPSQDAPSHAGAEAALLGVEGIQAAALAVQRAKPGVLQRSRAPLLTYSGRRAAAPAQTLACGLELTGLSTHVPHWQIFVMQSSLEEHCEFLGSLKQR